MSSQLTAGHTYRNTRTKDGDQQSLVLVRRVEHHGAFTLGPLRVVPIPVVGEVWLAHLYVDGVDDIPEIMCTPEGLAARGFVRVDPEAGEAS